MSAPGLIPYTGSPMSETGDRQEAFRERLGQLAERWSQSDLARRTDTPLSNVHRYLTGKAKVPAEFCCALVDRLAGIDLEEPLLEEKRERLLIVDDQDLTLLAVHSPATATGSRAWGCHARYLLGIPMVKVVP